MIYFLKYYGKDFKIITVTGLLSLWAVSMTYVVLTTKQSTILLQMNGFDTRVINSSENPPVEIENFFHNFVNLFYSFNSDNYESHMNRAVPFVDLDVFRQREAQINAMYEKLQKQYTSQFASIQKLVKKSNNLYELEIGVRRSKGETESGGSYTLEMQVERQERSIENPYGLIITRLEENNG